MFFVMIGLYLLTQPSIGLHCRSLRVAIHFAKEGWICYLPDCVGHGRSSGSWAVVESLEDLAQNLAFVARECSNRHPGKWLLLGFPIFGFTNRRRFSPLTGLPIFLNGESMGGLLVLYSPNFMDQSTLEKVTGILAICPALMVHNDAGDPIMEQFIRLWPLDLGKSFSSLLFCEGVPTEAFFVFLFSQANLSKVSSDPRTERQHLLFGRGSQYESTGKH